MRREQRTGGWFSGGLILGYVAIAIFNAWLCWRLPANVLGDDAAITLRYVQRAANGHGLTYNDHERVFGSSNPLYVLGLTLFTRVGLDPESIARLAGVALFATSAVLTSILSVQLCGSRFGLVAGLVLSATYFFRYQALSGMESILAVCLGLAVPLYLAKERHTRAGVFLGLAIWNKLDAGLLAIALAAAWIIVRRRFPWKLAFTSLGVFAPWVCFAWWYFGSPVPHSLMAKLASGRMRPFNHFWAIEFGEWERRWVLVLMAVTAFAFWKQWSPAQRVSVMTLGLWFALQLLAVSIISLGDYYPWYLTVLFPPAVILASALVGLLTRLEGLRGIALSGIALASLGAILAPQVTLTRNDLANEGPIKPWEAFDADRQMAGIFINEYADSREVLQTGFGWTAYEVRNPINDDSHLNSERFLEPASYFSYHGVPYETGSVPPVKKENYVPLATFNLASDLFPGYSWFVVFGLPNSRIARLGVRRVQYRLFELPAPLPVSSVLGLRSTHLADMDLNAEPPSGATFTAPTGGQPATIVFTPVVATDPGSVATVTFEVRFESTVIYHNRVSSSQNLDPVSVRVAGRTDPQATISFVTEFGDGDVASARGEAIWRNVKIIVGDAVPTMSPIWSRKIVEAWRRHNPTPLSGR